MKTLQIEFEAECWRTVMESRKLPRPYNPSDFAGMLSDKGGVATAHQLLKPGKPAQGFYELWERGRVDLSVEQIVLQVRYFKLFTPEERREALRRLEDMTVVENEAKTNKAGVGIKREGE